MQHKSIFSLNLKKVERKIQKIADTTVEFEKMAGNTLGNTKMIRKRVEFEKML